MGRLRYLNPFFIRRAVREIRRVIGTGRPRQVRLAGISHPAGWILPTATVTLEIIGRDGRVERFQPEVPVPFPYAWGWRIARRLGVPLVSTLEPERLRFGVGVPGRS